MLKKAIMTSAVLTISLALATPLLAGPSGAIFDVGNGVIVGVRSADSDEGYVQRNGNGISGGNPAILQGVMVVIER